MLHPAHSSKSLIDAELHRLRSVMLHDASSRPLVPVAPVVPTTASEFRPGMNQDPLFWCFYVMKHGAFKYEQLTNRFTAEQESKRNEIMALREREKQLKQSTGIKFTLSTIEGDIMSPRISLPAFQLLVLSNSLNAVCVNPHNHVYAEFMSDAVSDKPVFFIQRKDKGAMRTTMTEATQAQLASLHTTHYRIENMKKPIKSVSAYTVAELTEMCHQLKIQLTLKLKKQELYDAVVQKLVL
jgi:transcription initiation factor TFIIIB Brf1 subunit/transcription initiation factor TFIIB